jgi:3-mercaptopyruvate sulfurtransferase SseA
MSRTNIYNKKAKRLVYMCGTGWRASLAGIFAEELDLAEIITVLDSGWFEWSEQYFE